MHYHTCLKKSHLKRSVLEALMPFLNNMFISFLIISFIFRSCSFLLLQFFPDTPIPYRPNVLSFFQKKKKSLFPCYTLGSPRLMPRPTEVLAQAYFLGSPRLVPGPTGVSGSGLLPQQLLRCTCSCGVCSLRPALT